MSNTLSTPSRSVQRIAVFADPVAPRSEIGLSPAGGAAIECATAALRAVPVFSTAPERAVHMEAALLAMTALEQDLRLEHEFINGDLIPPRSPAQSYFALRTGDRFNGSTFLHTLHVMVDSLTDLRNAPLGGSDVLSEITAMIQHLSDTRTRARVSATADRDQATLATDRTEMSNEQTWSQRWIVGHQLHALFNLCASASLVDAGRALDADDTESAIRHLGGAAVYIRGFTAARAHTLALPASFYNEILRPTMMPPFVPAPLSGAMHVEYRTFRAHMAELLQRLPEPIAELGRRNPGLAFARENVLEADLADSRRHVTLVEPMVGNSKSIVQGPRSRENALSSLARIHHRRTSEYARFLRFGAEE